LKHYIYFSSDFQKAAAFINEFLLKLNEDAEGSELRDTLNLALLHMQKYYRKLQTRSHEKNAEKTLSLSARGFSPMTPFVDAPDKFQWKWVNLDNLKNLQGIMTDESMNITSLPPIMQAVKQKDSDLLMELVQDGMYEYYLVYICIEIGRLMYAEVEDIFDSVTMETFIIKF
jgi:inversin